MWLVLSLSRCSALKHYMLSSRTTHCVHQLHQIKHRMSLSGGLVYKDAGLSISGNISQCQLGPLCCDLPPLTNKSSIHLFVPQTARPQDMSTTEKHRESINIPLHQQTDWSQWDGQLATKLPDESQGEGAEALCPDHISAAVDLSTELDHNTNLYSCF